MHTTTKFLLFLAFLVLTACQSTTATPLPQPTSALSAALPTAAPLPTLYPTFTPSSAGSPPSADTPTPQPVPPTETPIDFSQPIITFRYEIPAVGLDRRFEGTLSSDVRLIDAVAGTQIDLASQARALLQIQNVLRNLPALEQPPADCNGRCPLLTYNLPVEGKSGSGWLQDDILLASIEFFFANNLGPHFPPETVTGLYRSASGYNVSHTVAILADGTLWRWQATDTQIPEPAAAPADLLAVADTLPLALLENNYTAACPSFPAEVMQFKTAAAQQTIAIMCPALTLPTTLTAVYRDFVQLAEETLDPERNFPLPAQRLPLDGLLFYQRSDGATLTIYEDGTQVAIDAAGAAITTTVNLEETRNLIAQMATSEVLPRGVAIADNPEALEETESLLLLRNELGVYELGWSETIGQGLLPPILTLDEWLVEQVGFIGDVVPLTPTPVLTSTLTITATVTATGTLTSTLTPTP